MFYLLGCIVVLFGLFMVGMCLDKDVFYGYMDRVCIYLSLFWGKFVMDISIKLKVYM